MTGGGSAGDTSAPVRRRWPAPSEAARVPDVSVVVVTYRNAARVTACLDALRVATRGLASEVVVVDDASEDDTVNRVELTAPDVQLLVREHNGGFAAACRDGTAATRGPYILFVTPNARAEAGAVTALLQCARRHPNAGIVTGRAVGATGATDRRPWRQKPALWPAVSFALGLTSRWPASRGFDLDSPAAWIGEERPAPTVVGAFMLVDRRAWNHLGGFDPAFFAYGEDADLCLRAAAAGWRPVVTPRAVVMRAPGPL